jgi:hypothetical protein
MQVTDRELQNLLESMTLRSYFEISISIINGGTHIVNSQSIVNVSKSVLIREESIIPYCIEEDRGDCTS